MSPDAGIGSGTPNPPGATGRLGAKGLGADGAGLDGAGPEEPGTDEPGADGAGADAAGSARTTGSLLDGGAAGATFDGGAHRGVGTACGAGVG
jgi:hypothetical protein